jgi:hypothetical protein
MRRRGVFSASLWAIVIGGAAGCGGNHSTPVFPVHGKLLVGGKPAAGAHVVFHAVDRHIVSRPVAITETDGSFRLMTYSANDGAPAGDYIVTLFWRDPSTPLDGCEGHRLIKHDQLYGFYFDSRSSPLRTTVRRGPNEISIQAVDPDDFLRN